MVSLPTSIGGNLDDLIMEAVMRILPNDELVNEVQQMMASGTSTLYRAVPQLLGYILRDGLWKSATDKKGMPFASFEAFVETILRSYPEVARLIHESAMTQLAAPRRQS
ncbi:MAG: hypothetical protein ACR2HE_04455 [Casimicrobiaceae bacterium]